MPLSSRNRSNHVQSVAMSALPEDSVYDCEWSDCSNTFRSLENLCKHLQEAHLSATQSPFHCLWRSCERHPSASLAVSCHTMRTSACAANEDMVKCTFKPFPKRNKLVMHVRTHTGERPFICEECGRGFARADGLASHRKRHEHIATARGPETSGPLRGSGKRVRRSSLDSVDSIEADLPSNVIGGVGVWSCRVCARRYSSLISARHHEAQVHPELASTLPGDDIYGLIPVQEMLLGLGMPIVPSASMNQTPPSNMWYQELDRILSVPTPADDSIWWKVAEQHLQSHKSSDLSAQRSTPSADQDSELLTPPFQ